MQTWFFPCIYSPGSTELHMQRGKYKCSLPNVHLAFLWGSGCTMVVARAAAQRLTDPSQGEMEIPFLSCWELFLELLSETWNGKCLHVGLDLGLSAYDPITERAPGSFCRVAAREMALSAWMTWRACARPGNKSRTYVTVIRWLRDLNRCGGS